MLSKVERFEITEAKLKKLENWKNNNVYQELDDENQNKISIRWVITEKLIDGISKPKARLAAHGFKHLDIHVVRKDSPTFLQGKPSERNVYLKPPRKAQTEKIWKLNTSVWVM